MKIRLTWPALLACAALPVCGMLQTTSAKPMSTASQTPKKIFAHYMVCCPVKGGGATLEDYKREIQEAQSRGIDGFALNSGGWHRKEPYYKQRTALMYEAARQLGTGFQLMVSMDYCCGNGEEETRDAVRSFKDHPNQFRSGGKPVLSTFAGEGSENKTGRAFTRAAQEEGALYVPYFYPRPDITEHPQKKHIDQVFDTFPDLDGFFYFGAAGDGEQLAAANARLAQKWKGAGKLFMAGVTPFYRGTGGNFRIFETRGFEGMAKQWEAAIHNNADWVEIVTWNDWAESSYVAPFGAPNATELWGGHYGPKMLSHVAYLDASRYYIDWFKSGKAPAIKRDELYYFYRLHPATLPVPPKNGETGPRAGLPAGAEKLVDDVFATLYLTAPAELTITSGDKSRVFALKAGAHHVSTPFGIGKQHFLLRRGNKTVLEKTGEHEISATDSSSRFNYFSGSAS